MRHLALSPSMIALLTACAASHPATWDSECPGEAPTCLGSLSGTTCCSDRTEPARCVDNQWTCGPSYTLETECASFYGVCEGYDAGLGILDASAPDAGMEPYDLCESPRDCVVTVNDCCGICGRPSRTEHAVVNRARSRAYHDEVACVMDGPIGCEPCYLPRDPTLAATCDAATSRCATLDLATPEYAACGEDADCALRDVSCCPCGDFGIEEMVAVRAGLDLDALLCGAFDPAECPSDCERRVDPSVVAFCDAGICRTRSL
ncbi:MAG: hypothetical protein AB7S26_17470 [Sandaracinaceae bacterium]